MFPIEIERLIESYVQPNPIFRRVNISIIMRAKDRLIMGESTIAFGLSSTMLFLMENTPFSELQWQNMTPVFYLELWGANFNGDWDS